MTPPRIGVLGFGEAGGEISRDLVSAGADVQGFDPRVPAPPGVRACSDKAGTAQSADVVLSVNSAADAAPALEPGLRGMSSSGLWADLNTNAARLKRDLSDHSAAAGDLFADVALMSPVPGNGLRTPMLVSGTGADRFAELVTPLGARVTVLEGPAGLAATKKLPRSVFFKGLAAAVVEALTAARAAGCEDWLTENIGDELAAATPLTVNRLVEGSRRHAVRRAHEMEAAADLLTELGVPPRIAEASRDWLRQLAQEADSHPPPAR